MITVEAGCRSQGANKGRLHLGARIMASTVRLDVPQEMSPFVGTALTRLTYLFPHVVFAASDTTLTAEFGEGVDVGELRREMAHTLYREKIYQETLEMRRQLIRALVT